jgi:ubiquinone/menaquinone biosynthesis C-methylase UbiE
MERMPRSPNICAGPFGALYDFYVEREGLMSTIGKAVWGVEVSGLYTSMEPIARVGGGATILDVPCGGGVAFRALAPGQDVHYLAGDVSEKMLARAERRARARSLEQIEFTIADMTSLPFATAQADLFLSYSGLHMIDDPRSAVQEIGRCLKPGGELVGSTFLAEGSRRHRALFAIGARRGHALPPRLADLRRWLQEAGIVSVVVEPEQGFAVFRGRKQAGAGVEAMPPPGVEPGSTA